MAHKIFVSYKYSDYDVANLSGNIWTKARDYVTELENILGEHNHIYKGEQDNEDLSNLSEETIWEKLKNRIFDSSITIVLISPQMKDFWKSERSQWIPWEVSFSLKETTRDYTSHSNALLAVVLPNSMNDYSYFVTSQRCCNNGCTTIKTSNTFDIIAKNMFNKKTNSAYTCNSGSTIYNTLDSYIFTVKWCDFIKSPDFYINIAKNQKEHINDFEITKTV